MVSLAASPSWPDRLQAHMVKQCAAGGEGLANFALDHASPECQAHVSCEPVECQL